MAEDDANALANDLTDDEEQVRRRIDNNKQNRRREKPCRTRFDVLAIPHKRAILDVYQNHSYHFPRSKVDNLKHKLQELYAMSPEETEKYFEQLKDEANEMARKKMMKIMLKRMYRKQQKAKQEKQAYQFVEKLLKIGMIHSFTTPVPPLISVRLRNLSDIILEQICDLRNLNVPNRGDPDQIGLFLIAVADWIAIAIEHIYYGVQLKKNEELAEIEAQEAAQEKEKGSKKSSDKKETQEVKDEKRPASAKDKKIKADTVQGGEDFFLSDMDME